MKACFPFLMVSVGLLLAQACLADEAVVWVDLKIINEAHDLRFQFPPVRVDYSEEKMEFNDIPVVSAYSHSGSYLMVPTSSILGEKKDGHWVFSASFEVLQSSDFNRGINDGCQPLSLAFVSSQARIVDEDEHCVLAGKAWQLKVHYWRSVSAKADKSKKKSWWEIKPANDKAKKRMNKI